MRIPERKLPKAAVNTPVVADQVPMGELDADTEAYFMASQWQLMWRKFRAHHLARLGGAVIAVFLLVAVFCEFLSPYSLHSRHTEHVLASPMRVRVWHEGALRLPFVYHQNVEIDSYTFRKVYVDDPGIRYPLKLIVRGDEYRWWGMFKTNVHLFGVEAPGKVLIAGTDILGRDMFSRILYATRISLSVGLVGLVISFFLGCFFGGISGYYGGSMDMFIQRIMEFVGSIPQLPLWMGIAAALPKDWPVVRVYFGITVVLSLVGWTGLARIVRGKLLELREAEFTMAARVAGMGEISIIWRHLLPSFMSYLIVSLTLSIPGMILGETALSFLGLGLRAPAVSYGVLLNDAQNIRTIALNPWLMMPSAMVIIVVLAFNFLGDGLRDAADPYK